MQRADSNHRIRRSVTVVALSAVLVASCGEDDETADTTPATAGAPATSQPAVASAAPATSVASAPTTIADPGGLDDGYGEDDGSGASTDTDTIDPPETTDAPGTSAVDTTAVPEEAEPLVDVGESSLGQILVTDGLTLYAFTPDEGQAGSTCAGDCAVTWPPLLADDDPVVGADLDVALLATIDRGDGTTQVTFDGRPLYRFAPDTAPGDVNGHGVGGVWFAIAPDGTLIAA